jgi:hypothetical protein
MQATDDWRRVQEAVWEHLVLLRRQGKQVPKPLHTLAERLQLIKPEVDEEGGDAAEKAERPSPISRSR